VKADPEAALSTCLRSSPFQISFDKPGRVASLSVRATTSSTFFDFVPGRLL
jgi:hypothetical protein